MDLKWNNPIVIDLLKPRWKVGSKLSMKVEFQFVLVMIMSPLYYLSSLFGLIILLFHVFFLFRWSPWYFPFSLSRSLLCSRELLPDICSFIFCPRWLRSPFWFRSFPTSARILRWRFLLVINFFIYLCLELYMWHVFSARVGDIISSSNQCLLAERAREDGRQVVHSISVLAENDR